MIIVIDDFLNETLLNKIKNDPTFFSEPGQYKWWGGWWNDELSHTPTIKQNLIKDIWGDNCPINKIYDIKGFEYWTGIQTADPKLGHKNVLGPHYDKDEALFKKTGEIVTPVIGTVYYPGIEEFEGGELAVYSDGADKTPEIIKAKPNRLIIFQAGQHVHEVRPVTKGTRHAIAINLWTDVPYALEAGELTVE